MRNRRLGAFALAAGLTILSGNALAVPLLLQFQSVSPGLGNFSIDFNDTGDGLLQFAEITAFSGLSTGPPATPNSTIYTSVLYVPNIAGIATNLGSVCPVGHSGPCVATNWVFSDGSFMGDVGGSRFGNYTVSSAQSVPEPATTWLLGLGALALVVVRRRPR